MTTYIISDVAERKRRKHCLNIICLVAKVKYYRFMYHRCEERLKGSISIVRAGRDLNDVVYKSRCFQKGKYDQDNRFMYSICVQLQRMHSMQWYITICFVWCANTFLLFVFRLYCIFFIAKHRVPKNIFLSLSIERNAQCLPAFCHYVFRLEKWVLVKNSSRIFSLNNYGIFDERLWYNFVNKHVNYWNLIH